MRKKDVAQDKIVKQIYDLALLSQNMLKGESLNRLCEAKYRYD